MLILIKSLVLFILAGLCEIGGGFLIWLFIKHEKPFWFAFIGILVLALYGFIATLQTSNFGRVYAGYGGIFIVMSLLWAWKVDNFKPDKFDIGGALSSLLRVFIIIYFPRK